MSLKFQAYVPDTGETIDVRQMEWNGAGVTWVTLMKGVPVLYRKAYGAKMIRRVPAHRVKLIQVGYLEEQNETDTK